MKENFEELLRELKGESVSEGDLGEKIKNVIRKFKSEIENRMIQGYEINPLILGFMKEEGIYDGDNSSVAFPIYSSFRKKFKPKIEYGMYDDWCYIFFENTPVPEKAKKDIQLRKDMEAKVDEYVKEHYGKPDPKDFREFVYSIHPKDLGRGTIYAHYNDVRKKHNIPEYKEKNQVKTDIESTLENLDLSDIK